MMSTMRLCCCGQTDPAAFITIGPDESNTCGETHPGMAPPGGNIGDQRPCHEKWHTSKTCDGWDWEAVRDALPGVIAESECNPFCLMDEDVIHRKVDAEKYEIDNQFIQPEQQADGTFKKMVRVGLEMFVHPYARYMAPILPRYLNNGNPNQNWFPGGCTARCYTPTPSDAGQGLNDFNPCPGVPPQCYELPFLPTFVSQNEDQGGFSSLRYTYHTGNEDDPEQYDDDPDNRPHDCTGDRRIFKPYSNRDWYEGGPVPESWYVERPEGCEGHDENTEGYWFIFGYQQIVDFIYEQILYRFGPQRLSNGKINPFPSQVYINIDSSGSHKFEESQNSILKALVRKFREDWDDEVADWKFNPCYQGPNCVGVGCCDECAANLCNQNAGGILEDEDGNIKEPSAYLDTDEFQKLFAFSFGNEEYVPGLTGLMRSHFLDTHCDKRKAEGCNPSAPRYTGPQTCTNTTNIPPCFDCWS